MLLYHHGLRSSPEATLAGLTQPGHHGWCRRQHCGCSLPALARSSEAAGSAAVAAFARCGRDPAHGPGAAPCRDGGPGLGSRSRYSSAQAARVMANPQGTPGQGTACRVSHEGHQGRLAITGPTLTDPASSAKGPGVTHCWDPFLIQCHGQAHLHFADSFSYCRRPSSDMSPSAKPSRNRTHKHERGVERGEATVLL